MVQFDSTDLDNATSESGVVHQSTANTDHNDASNLKQGYDYANFSEITPTPAHCWPLHENSGSTANDLAGSSNGSVSGATVNQTGLLGTSAYSFDGADDRIGVGPALAPNSSAFTIAMWVYPTSFSSTSDVYANGTSSAPRYIFRINTDGTLRGFLDDGSDTVDFSTTATLSTDTWQHIALTAVPSGDNNIYIDGVSEASSTQGYDDISGGEDEFIAANGEDTNHYAGRMADVRAYDGTALSQSQLQSLIDVVNTAGSLTTGFKSV